MYCRTNNVAEHWLHKPGVLQFPVTAGLPYSASKQTSIICAWEEQNLLEQHVEWINSLSLHLLN